MPGRVPTTVWRVRPEVVIALGERLGEPVDSYVNGSQVWLLDDEQTGATLEWRLHPVARYRAPSGLSIYELWETVVGALAAGNPATSLRVGDEERSLDTLWDGLECFPAHGDEIEPGELAARSTEILAIGPDGHGLVDHEFVGSEWERARGAVSIVDLLFRQLGG